MKDTVSPRNRVSMNILIAGLILSTLVVLLIAGIAVVTVILPLADNLTLALRAGLNTQTAVTELMNQVITRVLIGVAAAVVVQLGITVVCIRVILRRIRSLEAMGHELAEGNLTVPAPLRSRDAIGRLARSLSIAVHNLNGMAVRILQAVRVSNRSADELTAQIETTASAGTAIGSSARDIRDQVSGLSTQLDSASGAIEEILATINSLGDQIANQSAQVEQTSAAISEMGASIDSVARITSERRNQGARLVQSTSEGGSRFGKPSR